MIKSVFHAATLAVLLALLCLTAPAQAQCCGEPPEVPEGGETASGTVSPQAERLLTTPGGVDMRTGRYAYSQTDLSIGEHNATGGFALTRTMNQDVGGHDNPFGNFSHNWDISVTLRMINIAEANYHCCGSDVRIEIHFGGRSETFQQAAGQPGFEQVSRNGFAQLSVSGQVYTFTSNDGTVAIFRPITTGECSTAFLCGYVSQVIHADGTRFTFEYDSGSGAKRLRSVTSNRGYALLFHYGSGADTNHVVFACVLNLTLQPKPGDNICPSNAQASSSYSYSGSRLANAVDAGGGNWGFAYTSLANGYTMAFTRPNETTPWLTNTVLVRPGMDLPQELTTHQLFGDNSTYEYGYELSPQVDGEFPQVAGGYYLDPAGKRTDVEYGFYQMPGPYAQSPNDVRWQITPGPIAITDPLQRVTRYDYCDPNAMENLPSYIHNRCLVRPMPVSFTEPDGRRTMLEYDLATRNLGRSTRYPRTGFGTVGNIVTSATYNCMPTTMAICAKPVTTTDARGNVTAYSYDTTHGGLLSVTGPEPTAGAPRPQTRHTYTQRYAWIANGSGGYVQSGPIWVRTGTSTCRTSGATGNPAAPCAVAGDEVLTTYDYGPNSGPNTLLLRGQVVTSTDGGVTTSLRTCYGYDASGRRVSETQPNANLGSCP